MFGDTKLTDTEDGSPTCTGASSTRVIRITTLPKGKVGLSRWVNKWVAVRLPAGMIMVICLGSARSTPTPDQLRLTLVATLCVAERVKVNVAVSSTSRATSEDEIVTVACALTAVL